MCSFRDRKKLIAWQNIGNTDEFNNIKDLYSSTMVGLPSEQEIGIYTFARTSLVEFPNVSSSVASA